MHVLRNLFLMFTLVSFTACKKTENVDVVNGLAPRKDMAALDEHGEKTFETLAKLPAKDRQAFLLKEWPSLGNDVTAWLSNQGRLSTKVDSTVFHFGSSTNVVADDANGFQHSGFYTDQLVAYIYTVGKKEPMKVLVRCLNGTYALDDSRMERMGPSPIMTKFVIQKGEGLINYVSYGTAMMLAEKHGLKIFRGRSQIIRNAVNVDRARTMSDSTDNVQVTVRVFPGDEFDLVTGTYKPASHVARVAVAKKAKKRK